MCNRILYILPAACVLKGRCSTVKSSRNSDNVSSVKGPEICIYKTHRDHSTRVPVILPADKKAIVSYTGATDICTNGKPAIPTRLSEGFLPDNRGITQNIAFLKPAFLQHAALPVTPGADSLFNLAQDVNPLTVLYDCGSRSNYENLAGDPGSLIKIKDFSGFKNIKDLNIRNLV